MPVTSAISWFCAGPAGNYKVVGKTGLVTLLGIGLQTIPANIAVQSGDILGFFVAGGDFAFHQDCERVVSGGGGFISGTPAPPSRARSLIQAWATRFPPSGSPLLTRPRT